MRHDADDAEDAGDIELEGRVVHRRFTAWAALATGTLAVVSMVVAVTTPPRSGPSCATDCVTYPYTAVAAWVPRDYLWMYPTVLTLVALLALFSGLHDVVPAPRRVLSRSALLFTTASVVLLVGDYGVQLTVLQPSLVWGETQGLSVLSQYNPHGFFIGLENVGYALLAVAFLFLGAALRAGRPRVVRTAAWTLIVGGTATLVALVGLALAYGAELDYRFEVVALLITWLVLIATSALMWRATTAARDGRTSGDASDRWTDLSAAEPAPATRR